METRIISNSPIRTYRATRYLDRLAALLMALGHPFHFDGSCIEVDCSERFIERIKKEDAKLGMVDFRQVQFRQEQDMTLIEYYNKLPSSISPKTDFIKKAAKLCNVETATVRNWIMGRRKPMNPEHVKILALITNLKEEELFN